MFPCILRQSSLRMVGRPSVMRALSTGQPKNISYRVTSRGMGADSLLTDGEHEWAIGEPKALGGKNSGPNPLKACLGSLVACEQALVSMIGKQMKFEYESVEWEVEGTIDARGIHGDPDVIPYYHSVKVVGRIKTAESDERLLELRHKVNQRCPVARLFAAAVPNFSSELVRL